MHYDKSLINNILLSFNQPEDDKYTREFGWDISSFSGKDNRAICLKYLKHLQAEGLLHRHNTGFNFTKWTLSEDGKRHRAQFKMYLESLKTHQP